MNSTALAKVCKCVMFMVLHMQILRNTLWLGILKSFYLGRGAMNIFKKLEMRETSPRKGQKLCTISGSSSPSHFSSFGGSWKLRPEERARTAAFTLTLKFPCPPAKPKKADAEQLQRPGSGAAVPSPRCCTEPRPFSCT